MRVHWESGSYMKQNSENISVIICCYNSSPRLEKTLLHLSVQEDINPNCWEIILVDNNSTDNTANVAARLWQQLGGKAPLRIVTEPAIGLTHARAAGIRAAQYGTILFCDDDNWLHSNYLSLVTQIFSIRPTVGIAGPARMPAVYETPKPTWLNGHENVLCVFDTGLQEVTVNQNSPKVLHIAGAGMAIRKAILENYLHDLANNPHRFLLDRSPGRMLSGGDDDINILALKDGHDLYLTEKLQLQHFIPSFKLNKEYILRLYEGMAYSMVLLNRFHGQERQKAQGWNFMGMMKYMVVNLLKNPFNNRVLMRTIKGRQQAKAFLRTAAQHLPLPPPKITNRKPLPAL